MEFGSGGWISGPGISPCDEHAWGPIEHIITQTPDLASDDEAFLPMGRIGGRESVAGLGKSHIQCCDTCLTVRHLGPCDHSAQDRQMILEHALLVPYDRKLK